MNNKLCPDGGLHNVQEVAEQFVRLAANGVIGDELVEDLRRQKYSEPLIKLATEAEMTPWVFLDFVAEQVAGDAFNDIMLGSISPQLFGLLAMLNSQRASTAKHNEAMAQLSRDLEELTLVPA